MAAETTTGFEIDGKHYPVPPIDTFNMDEAQVLYDYSNLVLEDFVKPQDETPEETREREQLFRNPGLIRALMHVAYQRGNPKIPAGRVKALIGSVTIISAYESLAASAPEDGEADPPASTTELAKPSPSDSVTSSGSSGDASTTDSDEPAALPEATGTTKSDTPSPPSVPMTLVS